MGFIQRTASHGTRTRELESGDEWRRRRIL